MSDQKPAAPEHVKLTDLSDRKTKVQFIADFGYQAFAKLVTQDAIEKRQAGKK